MAAHRYTGQPLAAGQWITVDSLLLAGFAGSAARIVEAKRKSVVVQKAQRDAKGDLVLGDSRTKLLTSITFVCDCQEDAEIIANASMDFVKEETARERAFRAEAVQRKALAADAVLAMLSKGWTPKKRPGPG